MSMPWHGSAIHSSIIRTARRFASSYSSPKKQTRFLSDRSHGRSGSDFQATNRSRKFTLPPRRRSLEPRTLSQEEHKPFESFVRKSLLPKVAKARQPNSFALESYLRFKESAKEHDVAFNVDADADEDSAWGVHLEAGTFVELRKNQGEMSGVVLNEVLQAGERKYAILMAEGTILLFNVEDVFYTIPGFISADLSARCGLHFPDCSPSELAARTEVLKRIKALNISVERAMGVLRTRNVDIYSIVKSSNSDAWGKVTVSEALRLWSQENSLANHYATQKYLFDRPLHFIVTADFPVSNTFRVRPQSHVDRILEVQRWYRTSNNPIQSFLSKARAVITNNHDSVQDSLQKLEPPSWSPAEHSWSDDDKIILTYLMECLRPSSNSQKDPYALGRSYIVKGLRDDDQIDDVSVLKVLIDVGVFAPWQDPIVIRPDLGHIFDSETVQENERIAQRIFSTPAPSSQVLGPDDLYPSDPLESARHDFGQTPVLVIDDADAQELDDGISLEPVHNEPGKYWVHVHIADIASLLPPTHTLAQRARATGEAVYLLHMSLPLFPKALTSDEQGGRSLGATGQPQPVLTLSTKVDTYGGVHDHKIRAGIIRNVHRITYDSADVALGIPLVERKHPFGDQPLPRPVSPVPEELVDVMKILRQISEGFVRKRYSDGILNISKLRPMLYDFVIPPGLPSPTFEPSHFRGFVEMKYAVANVIDEDTGSHNMVAEMMKLACRAASVFCLEHDLPAIRRFSSEPVIASGKSKQTLLDMRSPNGYIQWDRAISHITMDGKTGYSVQPLGHYFLGVPDGVGYVRATSPLRRYCDLVVHWQIGAALLGKKAPFSKEWMESYAIQLKVQERLRRRGQGQHHAWWQVTYIERFLADPARREGRPNPFDDLEGVLVNAYDGFGGFTAQFILKDIGLRGLATKVPFNTQYLAPGAIAPLELDYVRTGVTPGLVVKVR